MAAGAIPPLVRMLDAVTRATRKAAVDLLVTLGCQLHIQDATAAAVAAAGAIPLRVRLLEGAAKQRRLLNEMHWTQYLRC